MIHYILKKSDRKYEKKVGWLKKISADFAIVDNISFKHTLGGARYNLIDYIRKKYGEIPGFLGIDHKTRKFAIETALEHTHWYFKRHGKDYIHRSFEDAQKWNTLVDPCQLFFFKQNL